ncbi:NUDIX hydrolase [uncultured Desulfatiglans sp.]|uniref:NUDIX hydrolase n=1 Tax=Uncultured Desulfatiglans sp. TaxID=1748965 RepID=A0A653A5A8_UNCDX|nr:NUDIX hydrolase [uncultured Desulfatiglans sp.]
MKRCHADLGLKFGPGENTLLGYFNGSPEMSYAGEMRKLVGPRRIFVPGVRAVIVNAAGEILLQRRNDNDLWGLPGGSVELDESPLTALRREVAEETSLEVVSAEPMGLYCGPRQKFTYPNGDEVQCFALAFIVRNWRGTPRADGIEGSTLRFFSLFDQPKDIVPVHLATIEDYRRYNGSFLLSH